MDHDGRILSRCRLRDADELRLRRRERDGRRPGRSLAFGHRRPRRAVRRHLHLVLTGEGPAGATGSRRRAAAWSPHRARMPSAARPPPPPRSAPGRVELDLGDGRRPRAARPGTTCPAAAGAGGPGREVERAERRAGVVARGRLPRRQHSSGAGSDATSSSTFQVVLRLAVAARTRATSAGVTNEPRLPKLLRTYDATPRPTRRGSCPSAPSCRGVRLSRRSARQAVQQRLDDVVAMALHARRSGERRRHRRARRARPAAACRVRRRRGRRSTARCRSLSPRSMTAASAGVNGGGPPRPPPPRPRSSAD